MDRSTVIGRAAEISETAQLLGSILAAHGQPEPSFEHGLPEALRGDTESGDRKAVQTRLKLIEMLDEFRDLLMDPAAHLSPESRNPTLSVYTICRFRFADHVPKEGISVRNLASKVDLNENIVRRLLSHAGTYHIFYQSGPDYFVHTAASRLLADNEGMLNWCLMGIGETLPATLRIPEVLQKYKDLEEPQNSPWSLHNRSEVPVFAALNEMPERGMVFAKAMQWHSQLPGFSAKFLINHFPFEGTNLVVDVGGGFGHIAHALASQDSRLTCVVQDLSQSVTQGEMLLPKELQGRVRLQVHDFFTEQPVRGADVYLLRHILHDWSNRYARKILEGLIPALKPGAKIIINDRIIPGLGEAGYLREREARDYDLYMFTLTNAQERTLWDWEQLLKDTDSRLKLTNVAQPEGSFLAVLEVTWKGTEVPS